MAAKRTVGEGRGAVFASDGKVYLEGAEVPAGVNVGDHVFDDVDAVEGNVSVTAVKPVTAESQKAEKPSKASDTENS